MATEKNIIFAEGALATDGGISFGELQDTSIEFRDTVAKAYGPSSVYALMVAVQRREATLRASYLKVMAQGLKALLGGATTYAAGSTALAITKNDIGTHFGVTLSSPSDGSDITVHLHRVYPVNFTLPMAMRDFTIPNFEAEIGVDDNDKVCTITLPGYQSVY